MLDAYLEAAEVRAARRRQHRPDRMAVKLGEALSAALRRAAELR
jgi:hypothetical protein